MFVERRATYGIEADINYQKGGNGKHRGKCVDRNILRKINCKPPAKSNLHVLIR